MTKTKIIHLITGLAPNGAEGMLYKLVQAMDKDKFDVYVISMTDEAMYGDRIKQLGVPVYTLGMRKNPLSLLGALKQYHKLLKTIEPDLVQAWMYHANALSAVVAKCLPRQSYQLVWNVRHSPGDMSSEKRLTRWLIKLNSWLSTKPQAIINNSQTSQQQHQALGFKAQRDVLIGNGFDVTACKPNPSQYYAFRSEYNLEPETQLIGNLARYHPMKNHRGLLALFKIIKQHCSQPIKLALGGLDVNESNQALKDDIRHFGLEDDCLLLDFVDSQAIMPVFDLYISTSLWGEGFPNVLGEAMACGVPCAASDVGDCRYLLDGLGYVFPPDADNQTVSTECLKLLAMTEEQKHTMRQFIIDHYAIDQIGKIYEKLYLKLTNVAIKCI